MKVSVCAYRSGGTNLLEQGDCGEAVVMLPIENEIKNFFFPLRLIGGN